MGGGGFPTSAINPWTPPGSPTIQLNYDTTQKSISSYRLKGQRYKNYRRPPPTGFLRPSASPSYHLASDNQPQIRFPQPSLWVLLTCQIGSQNSETRDPFDLLDHWVELRNSQREELHRTGESQGKGVQPPRLSRPATWPHLQGLSIPEALRVLSFWVLWRLHYIDGIDSTIDRW